MENEKWMNYMRNGSFEEAWKISDVVLKSGMNRNYEQLPRHFQCIWDGTPLYNKRVFIRCYHGLGDTIQFIRYASLVKKIAKEVIVWAQEDLMELLKTVDGIDKILPLHDGVPNLDFDVDIEIMELPFVFRTSLETIPRKVPYLSVEPIFLQKKNENLSLGLIWQAGDWNLARQVPFEKLMPLFKMEGLDIFILQKDALKAGWKKGCGIHPGEFSLFDYAKIVKGLDLIITVDSMPAHLAGALNVPVLTLLHYNADWRWLEHRSDSPWYPSMRLLRQEKAGDWEGVVQKVIWELKSVLENYKQV